MTNLVSEFMSTFVSAPVILTSFVLLRGLRRAVPPEDQ